MKESYSKKPLIVSSLKVFLIIGTTIGILNETVWQAPDPYDNLKTLIGFLLMFLWIVTVVISDEMKEEQIRVLENHRLQEISSLEAIHQYLDALHIHQEELVTRKEFEGPQPTIFKYQTRTGRPPTTKY